MRVCRAAPDPGQSAAATVLCRPGTDTDRSASTSPDGSPHPCPHADPDTRSNNRLIPGYSRISF